MKKLYNRNAERSVLSACILDNNSVSEIRAKINNSDYFHLDVHKHIYDIIIELDDANTHFDKHTIMQRVYERNIASLIKKPDIEKLSKTKPTENVLKSNIRELVLLHMKRVTIMSIDESREKLINGEMTVDEYAMIVNGFIELSDNDTGPKHIGDIVPSFEKPKDIKTNLYKNEQFRMGKGKMTVIGARPAMGKTRIAIQYGWESARYYGDRVYMASAEMQESEISEIIYSMESDMDMEKMPEAERIKIISANRSDISKADFIIDDACSSVNRLIANVRRHHRLKKIDTVIVDYLQMIDANGFKPSDRYGMVTYVSRVLTHLAKELNVRMILLSQLNRSVEYRDDKRPQLSDLRESGQIEQDAALILLLYRGEYYGIHEIDKDTNRKIVGRGEVICVKNRFGGTGSYHLHFGTGVVSDNEPIYNNGKFVMFRNIEDVEKITVESSEKKKDATIDINKLFSDGG